jgi:hypothetical protein
LVSNLISISDNYNNNNNNQNLDKGENLINKNGDFQFKKMKETLHKRFNSVTLMNTNNININNNNNNEINSDNFKYNPFVNIYERRKNMISPLISNRKERFNNNNEEEESKINKENFNNNNKTFFPKNKNTNITEKDTKNTMDINNINNINPQININLQLPQLYSDNDYRKINNNKRLSNDNNKINTFINNNNNTGYNNINNPNNNYIGNGNININQNKFFTNSPNLNIPNLKKEIILDNSFSKVLILRKSHKHQTHKDLIYNNNIINNKNKDFFNAIKTEEISLKKNKFNSSNNLALNNENNLSKQNQKNLNIINIKNSSISLNKISNKHNLNTSITPDLPKKENYNNINNNNSNLNTTNNNNMKYTSTNYNNNINNNNNNTQKKDNLKYDYNKKNTYNNDNNLSNVNYMFNNSSYNSINFKIKNNLNNNNNTLNNSNLTLINRNNNISFNNNNSFEKKHVRKFAYKSLAGKQEYGQRKTNQDNFICMENILNCQEFKIFGIFDGHGK